MDEENMNQSEYPEVNMIMYIGENGFSIINDPNRKKNFTPITKKSENGFLAEDELVQMFLEAGLPPEWIVKDTHYTDSTEKEFADALIFFGDTAFLIQLKSRNAENINVKTEMNQIRKRRQEAYKQAIKSLDFLKNNPEGLSFVTMAGTTSHIHYEDYNWVALIILNWNIFPSPENNRELKITNVEELPRVPITTIELERLFEVAQMRSVLNFLRRMQYQEGHTINELNYRYIDMLDKGLYSTPRQEVGILIEQVDFAVLSEYEKGTIDNSIAKRILHTFDFWLPEELEKAQKRTNEMYAEKNLLGIKRHLIKIGQALIVLFYFDSKINPVFDIPQFEQAYANLVGESVESYRDANTSYVVSLIFDIQDIDRNYYSLAYGKL